MEEQPKDRAQVRQQHHHHHHGENRHSAQHTARLKHDQSHVQRQHQETQTKKTGNKKVNIVEEEGEKSSRLSDTAGMSHPPSNGNRHTSNANVKQKSAQKLYTTVPKRSKGLDHKNIDLKIDKALDWNHHEGQPLDKKDSVCLQNGIVNCGLITNGYSSKDNDGSGSEGGYTTPKKRKARCIGTKNIDYVIQDKEKDMQQGNSPQEHGAFNPEVTTGKGMTSKLGGFRATHKVEAQSASRRVVVSEVSTGEPQRKNADGKAVGTSGKKTEERHKAKLSSPSREDPWTLFKPPPVFPVDNSSAKIVPKISYASKVKENLNKAAQGGGEALPPPVRLSQVPMSALKTITSASFTNGPVSGNGNGCPVGTFFAPAARSIPPAPSNPGGENVASPLESNCSSTSNPVDGEAYELRKCTLLIYPLNMQPVLPSARHLDPPAAQTNQKTLGDIFENQWGLSFINEPNLGQGGGGGQSPAEDEAALVTSQSESRGVAAKAGQPCFDINPSFLEPGPSVQDAERRTCVPCNASHARSPACVMSEDGSKPLPCGQEKTKAECKGAGSARLAPARDNGVGPAQGQLTAVLFGSSKEQACSKDVGRRCSWGSFDIKAAVTYHTKEMEFIFNLQKQDPKRVVVYDETTDGPNQ
ncbi:FMR1-interacting protein NUFIP2 [Brachionichthys hirsutus]|uniref:FMR1-interacting protein NUFIP2 n=1 Tax=Brachionichthys hirsutus TaxID=412623 RepID=UPI003604A538